MSIKWVASLYGSYEIVKTDDLGALKIRTRKIMR